MRYFYLYFTKVGVFIIINKHFTAYLLLVLYHLHRITATSSSFATILFFYNFKTHIIQTIIDYSLIIYT